MADQGDRSGTGTSRTHTFTYTVTTFADPFLVCQECGQPVSGYYNAPGHDLDCANVPCRHLGVRSTCMSWGPVDGCRCPKPCEMPHVRPPVTGNGSSTVLGYMPQLYRSGAFVDALNECCSLAMARGFVYDALLDTSLWRIVERQIVDGVVEVRPVENCDVPPAPATVG